MESSAYPMLFSPIKVGTTEVKNRVFMPPVSTNLADHGYVTDDLVDHYRARAKGGVGLLDVLQPSGRVEFVHDDLR